MSREMWDFDGAGRPIEVSGPLSPVAVDGWKCLCQIGRRRGRPSWQSYGTPCRHCGKVLNSLEEGEFTDEAGTACAGLKRK